MKNSQFASYNPATGEKIWEGKLFQENDIEKAVLSAENAFNTWSKLSFEERVSHLRNFEKKLIQEKELLSETISKETGKPLFDSKSEVEAMINKINISIHAYLDRCRELKKQLPQATSITRHKPHGIVAVFGPYNFPGHLPNGHLVPALLAGNTAIFKPSELTPLTAEITLNIWKQSGLPKGVIELVTGDAKTGEMLAAHPKVNGIYFTGSYKTGQILLNRFHQQPEKILALEMGGNNPLVIHEISDLKSACYLTIQSAFLSTGQRCTAARRLIVVESPKNRKFVEELIFAIKKIKVGSYLDQEEPFMGPLISMKAAEDIVEKENSILLKGGQSLVPLKWLKKGYPFLSAALIDVTNVNNLEDEEIFGPLLQLKFVKDLESAINEANLTKYGLSSGIFTEKKEDYEKFYQNIQAGVINWNCSLTGASSENPFGGIRHSGNFRPSAYYAADYTAYPVASMESEKLLLPQKLLPGIYL